MKRLFRILFNATSVMSMLFCLATAALWVRSYQITHFVGWSDSTQFYGALSMAGLLRFEYGTYPGEKPGFEYVNYKTPTGNPAGLWGELDSRDRRGGFLKRIGIASSTIDYNDDGKNMRRSLYLPHWLFAAAFGLFPQIWTIGFIRQKYRRIPGGCAVCGYDMRATPGRCPECGTAAVV